MIICPLITEIPSTLSKFNIIILVEISPYLYLTEKQLEIQVSKHVNQSSKEYLRIKWNFIQTYKKEYLIKLLAWNINTSKISSKSKSWFSRDLCRYTLDKLT